MFANLSIFLFLCATVSLIHAAEVRRYIVQMKEEPAVEKVSFFDEVIGGALVSDFSTVVMKLPEFNLVVVEATEEEVAALGEAAEVDFIEVGNKFEFI